VATFSWGELTGPCPGASSASRSGVDPSSIASLCRSRIRVLESHSSIRRIKERLNTSLRRAAEWERLRVIEATRPAARYPAGNEQCQPGPSRIRLWGYRARVPGCSSSWSPLSRPLWVLTNGAVPWAAFVLAVASLDLWRT
jgi:hypothetical protein